MNAAVKLRSIDQLDACAFALHRQGGVQQGIAVWAFARLAMGSKLGGRTALHPAAPRHLHTSAGLAPVSALVGLLSSRRGAAYTFELIRPRHVLTVCSWAERVMARHWGLQFMPKLLASLGRAAGAVHLILSLRCAIFWLLPPPPSFERPHDVCCSSAPRTICPS